MSGSGGKGKKKGSSKVTVPDFLKPLFQQGSAIATNTFQNLNQGINTGQDLRADFTPAQLAAQNLGIQEALNGTYIPAAQNTLLDATQGTDLSQFLDPAALESLRNLSGGQEILPEETYRALVNASTGTSQLPQAATDALTSTAQGDFLYGGEGFNAAIDAAMRKIQPQLISTFGAAGPGGATGGLSRAAIGQATADAFANQYGAERRNQMSAADRLAALGLAEQQGAAGLLGQTGASTLQNALGASQALGGFGQNERSNQLNSALQLPGIGTADINLLSGIGGQQQEQAQGEIDAPIDRQLKLLAAALGVPFEALLGSKNKSKSRDFGFEGLNLS